MLQVRLDQEAPSLSRGRSKALDSYGLLNAGRELAFDRITDLVANVFKVPRAYISLVDDEHQWFQHNRGTGEHLIPREDSFCYKIVQKNEPLVVADAARDPRFQNHPNVQHPPFIRFYAGVPLRGDDDWVLGALCIISDEPRPPLTAEELRRLGDFAEIIMAEMNLRRTSRQRDEARIFLERAVNFSELVIWQLDPHSDTVELTGAAEQLWGVTSLTQLSTGLKVIEHVFKDDRDQVRAELQSATATKAPFHAEFRVEHPDKGIRWIEAKGDWVDRGGTILLTGVNADITDRKNRQEHANILMRELHHRMRNLFATVGAIVSLTRQSAQSIDDYYERITYRLDALNRAQNVLLSANFMTGSMHALMCEVEAGFPRIRWSGPDLILPENALVSMALLLNELATNAVKHGAFMTDEGHVEVHWWHEDDAQGERKFHLRWSEGGASHRIGPPETTRFGTLLMDRSVRNNLGGHIERRWEAEGLICDIILPARWREN
jgi:PAS domain S-box-containing protein